MMKRELRIDWTARAALFRASSFGLISSFVIRISSLSS